MPPRYSYWTILAGGLPTAFRAAEREELLPTFQRLREKHPDAEMKWFAKGKLWDSPQDARRADDHSGSRPGAERGERRGRDWRPGGSHRDPRQPFIDAKKARNARWRQERFDRRQRDDGAPPDQEPRPTRESRGGAARPDSPPRGTDHRGARGGGDQRGNRPKWNERPPRDRDAREPRPRSEQQDERPRWNDRPRRGNDARAERQPSGTGDRPAWKDRPPRENDRRDNRAGSERPQWNDRPPRPKDGRADRPPREPRGDRPPWKDSAPGGKKRDEWHRDRDARGSGKPPGSRFPAKSHGGRDQWRDRQRDDRGPRQERPGEQRGSGRPDQQDQRDWRNRPPAGGSGDRPFRDRPRPPREDRPPRNDRGDWRNDERPRGNRPGGDWRNEKSGRSERGSDHGGGSDNRSRERFNDTRGPKTSSGPRRPKSSSDRSPGGSPSGRRPFDRSGFDRPPRGGESETPAPPKRPNRQPRPNENPEPTPPPRPSEPRITPPGPPERGRGDRFRRR